MKKLANGFIRGMTLVEIMIVLTVLLVVFGAVFLFFTRGSEEFDFSRKQNELITIGRLALEEVTDIILYAGYMPGSQWGNDEWHPVVLADSTEFEFYADYDGDGALEDHDYRNITISDERFLVTDQGDYSRNIGSNIDSLDFGYLDELGNPLPEPLSELDRDLVRHIQIHLVLTDTYRNTEYSTEVSTTISPRNLGLNHNIDPAFMPPDPLQGTVVFNVCGADTNPAPNTDEMLMINRMIDWGLTVIPLTDHQMGIFDFRNEECDLIVLRHRDSTAVFPHPSLFYAYAGNKDTLHIPVVTLNANDAKDIFDMGYKAIEMSVDSMTPANDWHPVNRHLPEGYDTFEVYNTLIGGQQSVLDSLNYVTPGDTVLTYPGTLSPLSGIAVRDENASKRVVHFSAYNATHYTHGGWQIFYNVIKWNVGSPSHTLGVLIEEEDFESEDDYSFVEPGYGEDTYCYLVSPRVSIPVADVDYQAIFRFYHCYWTRNRRCAAYLDISTDSVNWTQVPDEDLLVGYSNSTTLEGFPGGAGMYAYIDKSPGYNPTGPVLTMEEVDLEDYRGQDIWLRWVFGVEDKESNNQDGWIIDDPMVLLVDRDTTTALDSIRLDPWGLNPDLAPVQFRFWNHHEFPTYNDHWFYHHLYNVDPIYQFEQGYAWTTWGAIGYIGPWSHGGVNDSWEIGTISMFYPDPDPEPTLYNGQHYAGQDLTQDDGEYNSFETSYLLSEAWEVDSILPYSILNLAIYRCIRNGNDLGWVHMGFSTDSFPPDPLDFTQWYPRESGDDPWAREYESVDHAEWEMEVIDLSGAFAEAMADSPYVYYWVLFSHSSGPSIESGGWNIDNIQIWGNNE